MSMLFWLAACVSWLLGVVWQTGQPVLPPMWVCGAGVTTALLLLVACAFGRWRRAASPAWRMGGACVACIALCALAWSSTAWRAVVRMQEAVPGDWAGQDVAVVIQVEGLPQTIPGGVLFDARVLRWLPASGPREGMASALAHWPSHLSLSMRMDAASRDKDKVWLKPGQQWQLTVQLHAPDGLSNPGGFDATFTFFERGVRAVGRVQEGRGKASHPLKLDDGPEQPWQGMVDRWRQRIRSAIETYLPPERQRAAGILAGLTVGDQTAIEREDWDLFRQTGVSHLVSISGAHIAMFGWLAARLVRWGWARWPRGAHWRPAPVVALWVGVSASAAYALLAGWGVPAQRTVWMMLLAALLRGSGRRWPWPLLWLLSAVVLTAIDPWAIRQVGFWLSYVAVGVLMMSARSLEEADATSLIERLNERMEALPRRPVPLSPWLMIGRVWADVVVAMALSAWSAAWALMRLQWLITAALLPLSLVCFQQASLSSLAANLLAIPVFTLGITPLAMLGAVWAPCWDAAVWLIDVLLAVLSRLVDWWPFMASSPVLPWWAVLGAVLAGLGLAMPMHWRWRLGLLPFALPLLYLPQGERLLPAPKPGAFSLVAVDVGQGTAVLVRTAHHGLLFDTGPRIGEKLNAGDRTLLPLLRAMGIGALDTLLISHQDTDHVGGAAAIVRQMPVAHLLSSLDAQHPLRQQAGTSGTPLPHERCTAGMRWTWDGVDFEILHPWPQDYAQRAERASNAMSCVLKVSMPGAGPDGVARSALLTGDIEADQEAALVEQNSAALRSTVLVAPHHGSKTSSTPAFVRAVGPDQVVIQAGRRNRYGHPSPPVLARYEAMGVAWVASPDCGAYIWYSDEPLSSLSTTGREGGEGVQPRVGSCWRPRHHRYWDAPSPMRSMARGE